MRVLPTARPVVATQEDLAAALLDYPDVSPVLLGGPFVVGGDLAVEVMGDTKLTLRGRAHATARDRATVDARNSATVVAYDEAGVIARGHRVAVLASDRARVVASGADVTVYARARADVRCESDVQAWDHAFVRASDSCRISATDRVHVLVHAAEPDGAPGRAQVAAAGEARIAIDEAAAFVALHQASRLVLASGDVEVEIYGAGAGAERLGPRVRVTRFARDANVAAELETLRAVRHLFADLDEADDDDARNSSGLVAEVRRLRSPRAAHE